MAENRLYMALGEEANRGTAESSTNIGFIPLLSPGIPTFEPDDRKREEFRGENTRLGDTTVIRHSRKWSANLEMPFFTESGGPQKAFMGTLLKHYFGKAASAQNGTTGQYRHMFYPVEDPFNATHLGAKALTLNLNITESASMRLWPYAGGRIGKLSFTQEAGQHLKLAIDMFGQYRGAMAAEIGSPTFAAEDLRCDYNNLKVYTGTITRTGTGPEYTDFSFGSATQIKPDSITVTVEDGREDVLRLSGLDYPDKTRLGKTKVTVEMTIDWEDPASGFSSVDDFNAWISSASATNFFLHWDTGMQAGTGDNHSLYIDIPVVQRLGGDINYALDKDPMVTLKYEGLYDAATAKYIVGVMLKNTAASV